MHGLMVSTVFLDEFLLWERTAQYSEKEKGYPTMLLLRQIKPCDQCHSKNISQTQPRSMWKDAHPLKLSQGRFPC